MGSNDPNWAQMTLNGPKHARMTLNKPKWAYIRSYVSQMFSSDACECKTWHMLPF